MTEQEYKAKQNELKQVRQNLVSVKKNFAEKSQNMMPAFIWTSITMMRNVVYG